MERKTQDIKKMSTKDVIRYHLRNNRGREIPLSEIKEEYGRSSTAISNAIKELKLREEIKVDRRPLRHGRYAVIWLAGDRITEEYYHPDEVKTEERDLEPSVDIEEGYTVSKTNEIIEYLLSHEYDHRKFLNQIKSNQLTKLELSINYIQPILYDTGEKWEKSEITTGEEHLLTRRIEKIIYEFMPKKSRKKSKGTIVLCPVEGEDHTLNLLLLEMILSDQYKLINIGRSLPIQSLIKFLSELEDKIDWIFLSLTLPTLVGTLNRQINAIRENLPNEIKIAVGGQGISEYYAQLPEVDHVISSEEDLKHFLEYLRRGKNEP